MTGMYIKTKISLHMYKWTAIVLISNIFCGGNTDPTSLRIDIMNQKLDAMAAKLDSLLVIAQNINNTNTSIRADMSKVNCFVHTKLEENKVIVHNLSSDLVALREKIILFFQNATNTGGFDEYGLESGLNLGCTKTIYFQDPQKLEYLLGLYQTGQPWINVVNIKNILSWISGEISNTSIDISIMYPRCLIILLLLEKILKKSTSSVEVKSLITNSELYMRIRNFLRCYIKKICPNIGSNTKKFIQDTFYNITATGNDFVYNICGITTGQTNPAVDGQWVFQSTTTIPTSSQSGTLPTTCPIWCSNVPVVTTPTSTGTTVPAYGILPPSSQSGTLPTNPTGCVNNQATTQSTSYPYGTNYGHR